jgi:hypothetical protein
MHKFNVTICTETGRFQWNAIARHSCDLVDAAIDFFGPCAVCVVLT